MSRNIRLSLFNLAISILKLIVMSKLTRSEREKLKTMVLKILRDNPDKTGLSPDEWGFVAIDELISICEVKIPWARETWVVDLLKDPDFEILEGKYVRARDGHNYYVEPEPEVAEPPGVLYAVVPKIMLKTVLKSGLKTLKGRFTRLYQTVDEAWYFSMKGSGSDVIISIKSQKAYEKGVKFFLSQRCYNVRYIPPEYLSVKIPRGEFEK
ncbi:MAG: hypothetical protein DRH51_03675 [Candidatus Coatesbacteria bacterium]|nr:MAG: hypothetical protein DRH51_03675 [Candidatus Coatesbacteria bacterium]